MPGPLISIIVPVYKTPAVLLHRFVSSVLRQTLAEIQLIMVNDASPDECPQILDAAAAQDKRVTVLHRAENGRAGMARNDGMRLVSGQYVLFADADDALRSDACAALLGLACRHDADIVACSWSCCDEDGRITGSHRLSDRRYDLTHARQRTKCYRNLNYELWNKLFRYDVVASLRFEQFEANIGEDLLFNVTALRRSAVMVTTSYAGYDYTVHSKSATGRSLKGMAYLRTLALSGDRIRQVLADGDCGQVDKRFGERLLLKRFSVGCNWIAGHRDPRERATLWTYWHSYLIERLLPSLEYFRIVGKWYKLVAATDDMPTVYRLTRLATKVTDPMSLVDRIGSYVVSTKSSRELM
jgi:glycosyltransferase involved in cell wall biosynthesis